MHKSQASESVQIQKTVMSAQTLWGKVILYLREHNDRILHVMCGDIRDVEFDGEEFVISSKEDYVVNMLSDKTNYEELKKALMAFNINKFRIQKKQKQASNDENIAILNKFFGNLTKIID